MNAIAKKQERTPAQKFRAQTTSIATQLLRDWVGDDRAKEASGRVMSALSASAAAARNPNDFYACTPASIGQVIAVSALTGIMPSTGQAALAYAIPRRPRKGEDPQLQYQLSHRGVAALARRAGQSLVAVPISVNDDIDVDDAGEAVINARDFDNPPTDEASLRGVVIVVKDLSTNFVTFRGWVPKTLILERRERSDSYQFALKNDWAQKSDPWHAWFVEQAMKTAMHYAINRGWCVIDDIESVKSLSVENDSDLRTVSAGIPVTKAIAATQVDVHPETTETEDRIRAAMEQHQRDEAIETVAAAREQPPTPEAPVQAPPEPVAPAVPVNEQQPAPVEQPVQQQPVQQPPPQQQQIPEGVFDIWKAKLDSCDNDIISISSLMAQIDAEVSDPATKEKLAKYGVAKIENIK